jgi:exodeoxyribonuclease-5
MDAIQFSQLLLDKFPFHPTDSQQLAIKQLSKFLFTDSKDKLFVLKGYAGTGKTTLIASIVKNLRHANHKTVLLAPTGRAAKVLSNYAKKQAFTIHKRIYFPRSGKDGKVGFVLQPNKFTNTLFIIDEASMIGDSSTQSKLFESGSLLQDLISFVDSGSNCRLMFVGDTAQLPPVKLTVSPALNCDLLAFDFNKDVSEVVLSEVVRQSEGSGILYNATAMREQLQLEVFDNFRFTIDSFSDVIRLIDGHEIQEAIESSYRSDGKEETVVLVRSNKRANLYNKQIRSQILFNEHELSVGDFLMVVKNNYYWLEVSSTPGFIANGDIIEVLEIQSFKELYDFRFAEVHVQLVDYPNEPSFDTVLLLDTLTSESPALPYEDSNKLYLEVQKDYAHLKSKYQRFREVKDNAFFNALQVKFSYAITCHKSQGGQWSNVFVEQPYLPDGPDKDYFRWLYTAITRATKNLYLIGFKDESFSHN